MYGVIAKNSKLVDRFVRMKRLIVVCLLLSAFRAPAQLRHYSFSEIDYRASTIDAATPPELAYLLTKDYSTDQEKLRSIFSWIAEHISYRVKNYQRIRSNSSRPLLPVHDSSGWKSGNDVVAETVLQSRSAVCDGYARLFKSLCDYAGLRSATISGFANGDYNRRGRFNCNHTWNAVFIDSSWQLLDVTWASGYTNYRGDEFIKRFDDTYYLPAPERFMQDHFPDDLRWTLMANPAHPAEFNAAPYHGKSFTKYQLSSYLPATGIIEAAVGDTINIMLETADAAADARMAADTTTLFDDALNNLITSAVTLEPSPLSSNKLLQYHFVVANSAIEWLNILYRHDFILRYRLKIRKDKSSLAVK